MPKLICLCLAFSIFVSCNNRKSDTNNQSLLKDSLTNELNEMYKQGQFNGFSVAIVNEKGTLYEKGIGYANVANKQIYTENTIQNIASISKTFIGIALLKAQEMGKLKLDEPISKYLPFEVRNPYFPEIPITIRQLTTHTSGIVDNEFYGQKDYHLKPGQDLKNVKLVFDGIEMFNHPDSIIPLKDFLENLLTTKGKWYKKNSFLEKKPGEIYEYSNIGATLAAYIVEQATKESFDKFTVNHILKPLKMEASGWRFEDTDFSKYSRLYLTPDTLLPYYSMITYPDGNFITSASDMSKYLTELIKGYEGKGTLLTKESYSEFYKTQLNAKHFLERNEKNPYNDSYNAGVFIGFSFAGYIGHTGGDPGVSSMMFFNPKTKVGRYLIINTDINNKKGNDEFYGIWDILGKYEQRLKNQ